MADTPITVPPYPLRLVTFTGLELHGHAPTVTLPNLSADRLNVSGWDAGWPTGLVTNIDDRISVADGSSISTTVVSDAVLLDFTNATALRDIDTVNKVEVVLRAGELNGDAGATATLQVELLINGVKQGSTQSTGTLGVAFSNTILLDAGWDSDWTLAEVNSLQLRITSANAAAGIPRWAIDAIDINVIYVPLLSLGEYVPDGDLVLTGYAPVPVPAGGFRQARPGAGALAIQGYAAVQNLTIPVLSKELQLDGKLSYLDPLPTQLQINAWDSGWPTGFASNVDEPTATPDGSTVSTTIENDVAVFGLDDVTGIIVDLDTVLNVSLVVRARCDVSAQLECEVLVGGTANAQALILTTSMQNYTLTGLGLWDADWSVAQLNAMQLRITSRTFGVGAAVYIDSIDVIVKYVHQSPFLLTPDAGSLALSGSAPSLADLRIEQPLVGSMALAGTAPTLYREDIVYPGEVALDFTRYVPVRIGALYRPTLLGALVFTEKTPSILVDHITLPAAVTLTLAGKIPVPDRTSNFKALPGRQQLALTTEAPDVPTASNVTRLPPRVRGVLTGYGPASVPTLSVWKFPTTRSLSLGSYAPSSGGSRVRSPGAKALTLTGQSPSVVLGRSSVPAAASITLATEQPLIGGAAANLVLATQLPLRVVTNFVLPPGTALTLAGAAPLALGATVAPDTVQLTLATTTPSIDITVGLIPGGSRIISLTIDYDIEFIATPTVILID